MKDFEDAQNNFSKTKTVYFIMHQISGSKEQLNTRVKKKHNGNRLTSKASSMPSSDIVLFARACATTAALYLRTKYASSVAKQTRLPLSDQNTLFGWITIL